MILKHFERNDPNIAQLEALLKTAPAHARPKIQDELSMMKVGHRAERETAYILDFCFGYSDKYIVMHGLRLELNGRVAQIDHLVITQGYGVYILETKSLSGTVRVQADGTFARKFRLQDDYVPISSPIEQVTRHRLLLEELFKHHIEAPRALFIKVMPRYYPVIILHNTSKFYPHPSTKMPNVMNKDMIRSFIINNVKNERPLALKPSTLWRIGAGILAFHVDKRYDYSGRFGISQPKADSGGEAFSQIATYTRAMPIARTAYTTPEENAASQDKQQCEDCGCQLTMREVRYCWFEHTKLKSKLVCATCRLPYMAKSPSHALPPVALPVNQTLLNLNKDE